jgi:DHA3 family tetracycline resistance protein-like MFS transporter
MMRPAGRIGALRPLRHRDFALMWTGLSASLIGDGVYLVAIAWQAYELSGSPAALSAVGVAWTLPTVVLLLAGGVVSDRRERRRVMLTADVMRALVVAVLAALSLTGALHMWELIALVAVYGAGDALFYPAYLAIVPVLVPADEVVHANALEQLVRPLALRFAGPAIGGLIVGVSGPGAGFGFDAVSFGVSAACLAAMRALPPPEAVRRSFRAGLVEAREGLAYVRSHAWLWATMAAAALGIFAFYGPLQVLLPYRIKNELGLGAGTFGAVLAASGLARVAAAFAIGQRGLPRRNVLAMYLCWSASTAAIAGYAYATASWTLMAIAACAGALEAVAALIWGTLMQTLVPERLLGRVSSVDLMISIGLVPLSFALAGPLAEALGTRAVLIGAGGIGAVCFALFPLVPGVRDPERGEISVGIGRAASTRPAPVPKQGV